MTVTWLMPWAGGVVFLCTKEKWKWKELKWYGSLHWATVFYDLSLDACVLSDYKYYRSPAFHNIGAYLPVLIYPEGVAQASDILEFLPV